MQKRTLLITGGAGFIGSHLLKLFVFKYPNYFIVNLDALTYASDIFFISDLQSRENYKFIKGNINDFDFVLDLFEKYRFDGVIHLAAESHVDRSIANPFEFAKTNIIGTLNLLESSKRFWTNLNNKLFYHVSTDEVYGSLGTTGFFTEKSPYNPNSPYAASKASSDHFVRAYGKTYKLPFVLSNCSNNYGANQHREKFIPMAIYNIINEKPVPIYGDGMQVRDWLFVQDHCVAMDLIFHKGLLWNTYNIGGNNQWKNIDLIKLICDLLDAKLHRKTSSQKFITFVKDRKGHDTRYAIDAIKMKRELDWQPNVCFKRGIEKTIDWYLEFFKNN